MAVIAQTRQQAKSRTLSKAMRWWIDGWVMFVRSGGGTVDPMDSGRPAPGQTGRTAVASHD
jgi:hypothetical protein